MADNPTPTPLRLRVLRDAVRAFSEKEGSQNHSQENPGECVFSDACPYYRSRLDPQVRGYRAAAMKRFVKTVRTLDIIRLLAVFVISFCIVNFGIIVVVAKNPFAPGGMAITTSVCLTVLSVAIFQIATIMKRRFVQSIFEQEEK